MTNTQAEFDGLYFAGREKLPVRFSVSQQGTLEFVAGEHQRLRVALQSTALELLGDPPTTLQVSWSEGSDRHALLCREPVLFDRLLALGLPPETLARLATLQKKQRRCLKHDQRRVPVYLGLTAAFLMGGYFLMRFSVPLLAEVIPFKWEQKIGAFAVENYQVGKKTIADPQINQAVTTIVSRIDRFDGAEISYQVTVVDAEMINAFAFPGGYVVVTTGLIEHADNPEQVAGVLAHELTHVLERHSMRKLLRQAGLGVLIGILFGDVSALSQLVELASQLDGLSFDRDQERDADDGATKIMAAAGLSPRHLATFFETLRKQDTISAGIPELLQTHPLTDERISRVSAAPEPEQVYRFEMDWNDIKQRLKPGKATPKQTGT